VTAVRLEDDFWAPRRRVNQAVTLPGQYRHLEETGRLDNFRVASGRMEGSFTGIFFNDSDVYKWLEAASWVLATSDDPELARMVDEAVDEIAAAQQPNGYLNTYYMFEREPERWSNLRDMHELYCAGHLIQAAVTHHRATGGDKLLQVACRLADCIGSVFGPGEGQRGGAAGHEEIEMALVELARDTGEQRYLDLAQFLTDSRGEGYAGGDEYHQDHRPVRALDEMVGHAVRAVYLNAGMADLYAETGDAALLEALERLWQKMVGRRMYVSGGIGARYQGEAFGADYELPNARAYAETCAAIGSVMWNWRMLAVAGDARYADLIEHTLYNAVLVGLSLDGQSYFYQNPLENDGRHRRQPWFGCACCPPNIARTLAWLPGILYSISEEGIWVHLYAAGEADLVLADGSEVRLVQQTDYPWDGRVTVEVEGEGTFGVFLRIPGWCVAGVTVRVNDQEVEGSVLPGSYLEVRRTWQRGDRVILDMPMPVQRIEAHPYLSEDAGRVALQRGPILYCVEGVDHPGVDLRGLVVPDGEAFEATFEPDLLGGVTVLRGSGVVCMPDVAWEGKLYRARGEVDRAEMREVPVVAVPYYAWANREPGQMRVWLRRG